MSLPGLEHNVDVLVRVEPAGYHEVAPPVGADERWNQRRIEVAAKRRHMRMRAQHVRPGSDGYCRARSASACTRANGRINGESHSTRSAFVPPRWSTGILALAIAVTISCFRPRSKPLPSDQPGLRSRVLPTAGCRRNFAIRS